MRSMTRVERPERSRLRQFFEDVVRRNLDRAGASSTHVEIHAAAVEHLERWCKRPLAPDEVDDELLLNFESHLWRQGISDNRRRNLVESLRRICRAYQPGPTTFTKRCQRRPLPDPPPGSLRHFYETVYVVIHLVGRSERYIDENRAALWRLHEHYGRDVLLSECGDGLLSQHVGWLLEQGLKPATINTGHLAVILAILRRAHGTYGLIDRPPVLRKLPVDENQLDALFPEEVAAFIEACPAASTRPIAGIPAADWWEALVRIVWYSGLRRRAVLAIRRDPPDVDFHTRWLRVPGSSMKNRRGQQFRLGVDAIEAIARIWEPRRELLLPFPHEKGLFYDQFHRIRAAAGLPRSTSHAGCLHLLRRSTATEACRAQGLVAAQTLMGHSSPALTRRSYIDPTKLPGQDFTKVLRALPRRGAAAALVEPPAAAAG